MSAVEPSRLSFVDVTFAPEARAIVTIATSTQHPLCANGVVVGPLTLEVTPELNVDGPFFGSQVLDRVEVGLAQIGYARTGQWQEREHGFVAWVDVDRSLWPLVEPAKVVALVEAGVLP